MTFSIKSNKYIDSSSPMELNMGMEGWFTLRAIKDGAITRESTFKDFGPFKNLILNAGLDGFGQTRFDTVCRAFVVGTGTAIPDPTQTALSARTGTFFNSSVASEGNSGAPDYYSYQRYSGTSAIGAFGTANLTEIGIGNPSISPNLLFSRALIADSSGNPVSFPINADEQLQASYELRIYPPLTDSSSTVTIGTSRSATVRSLWVQTKTYWGPFQGNAIMALAGVGYASGGSADWFSGGLSAVTERYPLGTVIASASRTAATSDYVTGSYTRNGRWSYPAGAATGTLRTHAIRWGCAQFQIEYDAPIVKGADQTLYVDYQLSWGRR